LFHASNRGYSFDPEAEGGTLRRTTFGACDVVGCGVYQAPVDGSGGAIAGPPKIVRGFLCSASGRKKTTNNWVSQIYFVTHIESMELHQSFYATHV